MSQIRKHTTSILSKARELGFHAAGIVDLNTIEPEFKQFYTMWLNKRFHGEMHYMEKNAAQRFAPEQLLTNAQSAIVVLASYNHGISQGNSPLKISRYAVGLDYHFVLKNRLNQLLTYIQTFDTKVQGRAFTDSAPVAERYLATKAGLGFIGKNGMLINSQLGSYTFIGELFLDAELDTLKSDIHESARKNNTTGYAANFDQCANCDLCMRACPNNAIVEPGIIDSNKCISYKTIEYKGELSANDRLAGYIFGCDNCQQVCPYNKEITTVGWTEFKPKATIESLTKEDWLAMGSSAFKRTFTDTVLFRTGLKRLRRNIAKILK
ncbi:MAG: tRNA epoxyqueuosine(34) reductase QueG [Salinivirgaceae bacterium]|jgi:epoxyqueuosine reductase|nr:tRNA epoxyqueuosine(34) reductase QueG [Salinivirgaceae bacterium]